VKFISWDLTVLLAQTDYIVSV